MDFKMDKLTLLLVLLLLAFVTTGCGKYKVSGKVLFEDDDSPVTRGVITFIGDNVIGSGRIQSDGSYSVGIKTEKDGIPKGDYVVTIETSQPETSGGSGVFANAGAVAFVSITDTQYASSSRSGLTATVPSEDYTFHVKRARQANVPGKK